MKETLLKLSDAFGVSGMEEEVKKIIREELKDMEIREDRMGNLVAFKKGEGEGSIMIATHMDEIGLIVTTIEENFLRFTTVGGIDTRILPGQEVVVYGKKKINGVIGAIPPHFTRDGKREVYKMEELFIDTGYQEEIKELVSPGDFVGLKVNATELKNGKISGKALDNRVSCTVLIHLLKEIEKAKLDIYGVFTIQEETTRVGAVTSTYSITPTCAIAIDVTHARTTDAPDVNIEMGKGPALGTGPNIHPYIFQKLREIAEREEIPYQIEPLPGDSGTDAWNIQVSREGIPTGLLSIPLKYMHTPTEVVDIRDMERAKRLLLRFLERVKEVESV